MKRLCVAAFLLLAGGPLGGPLGLPFLGPTPAAAEKWDLSTMTCQQFLQADKATITVILTWLDAYYKDEDAPPVIDTDTFLANAEKLAAYCAASPNISLITAADEVFD